MVNLIKGKQNYFIIDETYSNEVISNERYEPCRTVMLLWPELKSGSYVGYPPEALPRCE